MAPFAFLTQDNASAAKRGAAEAPTAVNALKRAGFHTILS